MHTVLTMSRVSQSADDLQSVKLREIQGNLYLPRRPSPRASPHLTLAPDFFLFFFINNYFYPASSIVNQIRVDTVP